jgi:hypothetical protein
VSDGPTDAELIAILVAVQDGDDANAPLDNDGVAHACQLSLEVVADRLAAAKGRNLIWGFRSNQPPAPWYTDLELTVQGRRFVARLRSEP